MLLRGASFAACVCAVYAEAGLIGYQRIPIDFLPTSFSLSVCLPAFFVCMWVRARVRARAEPVEQQPASLHKVNFNSR